MTDLLSLPCPCPHCHRAYKDANGLKCHIADKHPDGQGKPVLCDYCSSRATFLPSSSRLYAGRDFGPVWYCDVGHEPAWVGCHEGTRAPLGRLADPDLRRAKVRAHAAFDPLWKGGGMSRRDAYAWLAEALGLTAKECHLGRMGVADCLRTAQVCRARTAKAEGASAS